VFSHVKGSRLSEFIGTAGAKRFQLNLAFSRHWLAALLTPPRRASRIRLWYQRERPKNLDGSRTKPRKSDTLVHTVFRKAAGILSLPELLVAEAAPRSMTVFCGAKLHFDGLPLLLPRVVASASFRPRAMPAATARAMTSLISPAGPISKPNSLRIK
jgi:hypothetical protein